jgi:hypothetical protein
MDALKSLLEQKRSSTHNSDGKKYRRKGDIQAELQKQLQDAAEAKSLSKRERPSEPEPPKLETGISKTSEHDIVNGEAQEAPVAKQPRLEPPLPKTEYWTKYSSAMQIAEELRTQALSPGQHIRSFLKILLCMWGEFLHRDRSAEHEEPTEEAAYFLNAEAFRQTCEDLKPLFHALKHDQVDAKIMKLMESVLTEMSRADYRAANTHYLELAIGNAPWPIGVTMVGIHARAARSRISDQNVSYVLRDEMKRKYIQSIKRLISFCQFRYPPSDLALRFD